MPYELCDHYEIILPLLYNHLDSNDIYLKKNLLNTLYIYIENLNSNEISPYCE